jgi:YD repeat-containing protein
VLSTIRRIGSRCAHASARARRQLHAALALIAIGVFALFAGLGQAGQERYDYDPIGRLIRFTDSNNEVTEYTYDKAGNITSVVRGAAGSNQPPLLSTVSPSVIRLGETATLTITGQRLQVGTLQASDTGLDLSNVRQAATQVQADLSVTSSVPAGTQTLTFTNGQGTASIALLIAPKLPTLSIEPSPLALPPDNTARSITLRLSNPDLIAHQVTVTSSDTAKATVSPATVTIAAGQTTAQVSVTPKVAGFVNLTTTSPTLKATAVPVFITSDFRGVNTSYAMPLGVRVGDVEVSTPPSTTTTFKVNGLGVVLGPVLTTVAPRAVAVGGTYTFTISGAAIPAGAQVSMVQPDGVTVTTQAANPSQITASLAIDPAAAVGQRRFVVKDAAGNLVPFADAAAANIQLTTGEPSIISVEPLFTTPGKVMQLRVRGANLQDAQVRLVPPVDVAVDNSPAISADGSELTVRISTSPLAATGPRTVQIVTPSGQTGTAATAANQLTIVSDIRQNVTPIFAPALGVQVGGTSTPSENSVGPAGGVVGVVVGPAAYTTAPAVAVVGETTTLVIRGTALQGVTQASVQPATGITHAAFTVSADGTTLSLPTTVDPAAARGIRRVVLKTATGQLVFADASGDQVLVATPAPELTWVKPQVVLAGNTISMTILGRNFNDVTGVTFEPPAGLTAMPPIVASADGTVLTFSVQVAAAAQSGSRTVRVVTAGGTSAALAAPSNTFQVARQAGPTLDSISAAAVGLQVGSVSTATSFDTGIHAPQLGVLVQPPGTPVTEDRGLYASNVGILVGSGTTGISPASPDGVLKGTASTITVTGFALGDVTSATVLGPTALTAGQVQVNSDGTQLTVPITVPADATSTYYGIRLSRAAATPSTRITPVSEYGMFFNLGSLPTTIDSVAPIVLEQGKTYTFTIRGSNLRDVYQVMAEPGAGLLFGEGGLVPQFSTDTFGEKLTVQLRVEGNAPIGSRVVRLKVPGGITSADPIPANTITVVAPQ